MTVSFWSSVVIRGEGECSTVAASLGGSVPRADQLGPKVYMVLYLSDELGELSQWQHHDDCKHLRDYY